MMATSRITTMAALFLFSLLLTGCGRPPLRVHQADGTVIIDVATLGEYPTTIKRLRISNQSTDEVIWEVVAITEMSKIWSVELTLGSNPSQPPEIDREAYIVVFPSTSKTFTLDSGVPYRIEAWGTGRSPARMVVTLGSVITSRSTNPAGTGTGVQLYNVDLTIDA